MLWTAGHERADREQRGRMTELFLAVRDANERSLVPVVQMDVKKMPTYPRPAYLPVVPPQTLSQYNAALTKFGKLGLVRKADA